MTTPGIWLHCANNSLASPRTRMLNPFLVRYGWEAFLRPTISLVERFHIPIIFIVNPFGDDVRKWPDGTYPTTAEMRSSGSSLKRQTFHAHREAVRDGLPDTVMNLEELAACVRDFNDARCRVVMYLGPWLRGTIDSVTVRYELDWLFTEQGAVTPCVCEDGSGARLRTDMEPALRANELIPILEPMSQRITTTGGLPRDPADRALDSITLETTLEYMDGFYPIGEYTGTRYWVDNVNRGYTEEFWTLARSRMAQGFVPCIEPRGDVFAVWDEAVGNGGRA